MALKAGQYELACKPGMVGKGIRTPDRRQGPVRRRRAVDQPANSTPPSRATAHYVRGQARLLQTRAKPFVAAVQAGDIAKAKSLYAARAGAVRDDRAGRRVAR